MIKYELPTTQPATVQYFKIITEWPYGYANTFTDIYYQVEGYNRGTGLFSGVNLSQGAYDLTVPASLSDFKTDINNALNTGFNPLGVSWNIANLVVTTGVSGGSSSLFIEHTSNLITGLIWANIDDYFCLSTWDAFEPDISVRGTTIFPILY